MKLSYALIILSISAFVGCDSSDEDESPPDSDPAPTALYDPAPTSTNGALATYSIQSKWQKSSLTYFIYSYTASFSTGEQQSVIRQAFNAWSSVTPLSFTEVGSLDQADMLVGFGDGAHCDLYQVRNLSCPGGDAAFAGPGNILAHAYFPGQGTLSGESHFDNAESWSPSRTTGNGFSLLSVAMHEVGHALGLQHSNDRSALMWAEYNGSSPIESLRADDIAGIQALYGSVDGSVPPEAPAAPPSTPPVVPSCGQVTPFDSDGDGVDDATEQFFLGTNPFVCDTDGDGLTDSEVYAGLNPLNPDSDGDGASDGEEVAAGSNPFVPDQGGPGGYIPGRYVGFDSAGSALDFFLAPDGSITGSLTVPGFFGPTVVPLFGGIDQFGQVVMLSFDYFFSLVGFSVAGGIQGQLQTANGGFANWSASFGGVQNKREVEKNEPLVNSEMPPADADPWQMYVPPIGERIKPTHRSLAHVR